VAIAEEADDLVFANLIIVLRGRRTKFYFFELRSTAALALFVRFFVGLIEILAVVGDLADWRVRRRSSSITRSSRARIRSLTRMRSLCRKLRSAIFPPK
jgi:hypothetical protein